MPGEAMRAVIALLFEQLAHHRLTAVVDTRNTGAIKLWKGWAFVARRITGKYLFKGEWGDEYLYALSANISEVTGEPSLLPGGR